LGKVLAGKGGFARAVGAGDNQNVGQWLPQDQFGLESRAVKLRQADVHDLSSGAIAHSLQGQISF
jgi:hypothetical protein